MSSGNHLMEETKLNNTILNHVLKLSDQYRLDLNLQANSEIFLSNESLYQGSTYLKKNDN